MPKKVGTTQWRKRRRKEYLEQGQQTEPLYFERFKKLIENNPIY